LKQPETWEKFYRIFVFKLTMQSSVIDGLWSVDNLDLEMYPSIKYLNMRFQRILYPSKAVYDIKDPFPNGGPPPLPWPEPWMNYLMALMGSFTAIAIPVYLTLNIGASMLLTSMGASAVLFHASPNAPLTQPRNVLLGNLLSAFIGVSCRLIVGDNPQWFWCSGATAVSLSVVTMMLTRTVYPPGGATALATAILDSLPQEWSGYFWLVLPVLAGTMFQLCNALLANNFFISTRHYPDRWW
jgi:CBS-domain-containing membrane protein